MSRSIRTTISFTDNRKKREENAMTVRKNKREENLMKKRNLVLEGAAASVESEGGQKLLTSMPEIMAALKSGNIDLITQGVVSVRKMLSTGIELALLVSAHFFLFFFFFFFRAQSTHPNCCRVRCCPSHC
jgi:CHASE3 domain sensor protein